MDIDERKIGEWPNVALIPGTHTHAATGEHVEQPESTRIGHRFHEAAKMTTVDTRKKLEAWAHEEIAEKWAQSDREVTMIMDDLLDLLDRQAAITEHEWLEGKTHIFGMTFDEVQGLQAKVDSLTAELESYRKVTDQNEREECSPETIDNMLNEIGELEEQVAELTTERDRLKRKLENQATYIAGVEANLCRYESQLVRDVRDIDKLTAERDELREKNSRQRRQLGKLQDAIHERNEGVLKRQWQHRINELTAERDHLKDVVKVQANSFAKLEQELALAKSKLKAVER